MRLRRGAARDRQPHQVRRGRLLRAVSTDSVGRGAFYRYDFWSWGAEACVGLLAVGLTALMVGHQLRTRTGWEVPFGATSLPC
jgi:hypothetical protein